MRFYGVGTVWGGKTPNEKEYLDVFLDNDFWCMGYSEEEKPNYAELIMQIKKGDILIAKAYVPETNPIYYVKAIGIVSGEKQVDNISEKFIDKLGVSVIWFKKFKPYIPLSMDKFKIGGNRTHTVYEEKNEKNISVIQKLIKFDYELEV